MLGSLGLSGGASDEGGEEGGGRSGRSAPGFCLVEGPWALSISFSEEDYGYPVQH